MKVDLKPGQMNAYLLLQMSDGTWMVAKMDHLVVENDPPQEIDVTNLDAVQKSFSLGPPSSSGTFKIRNQVGNIKRLDKRSIERATRPLKPPKFKKHRWTKKELEELDAAYWD